MKRMNKIIILFLTVTFICADFCFAYHVKISPVNEQNYYQMYLGETVTFKAEGMDYDSANDKLVISNEGLAGASWEFDAAALEEISRTEYTITLRAVKKKNTYLRIKAKMNGYPVEETIGIVIQLTKYDKR